MKSIAMATLEPNPLVDKLSGSIGRSLVVRKVGGRTYVSSKPRRRRKRDKRKRSQLQIKNSWSFKLATEFSKRAIKTPEIKAYFSCIAVQMGGTNNAYTALVSYYKKNPGLTYEKVLEIVQNAAPETADNEQPKSGLEFLITGPSGDTIAQGVATSTEKGEWSYVAAFTGVKVRIIDRRQGST
jgi:hypothetical protein